MLKNRSSRRSLAPGAFLDTAQDPGAPFGTGSMGNQLTGYLVLQGNIPFRTAQFKHFIKLLARKRLGSSWAKYPLSQCRTLRPAHQGLPYARVHHAHPVHLDAVFRAIRKGLLVGVCLLLFAFIVIGSLLLLVSTYLFIIWGGS